MLSRDKWKLFSINSRVYFRRKLFSLLQLTTKILHILATNQKWKLYTIPWNGNILYKSMDLKLLQNGIYWQPIECLSFHQMEAAIFFLNINRLENSRRTIDP